MSKAQRKRNAIETLDAVALFVADQAHAPVDLDDALRAEGYDPESLTAGVLAEVKRRTWKSNVVVPATPAREPRPAHLDKAHLLIRLAATAQRSRQTVNFKNANELSADDLWDILQDMESKGEP